MLYGRIGGESAANARYPFNTALITNDFLLHIYHKLFSNGLKYYEEQIARPTLVTLSEKLYQQYLTRSQQEKNPELQSLYEFLAAYWAVPQIFLPSNQFLIDASFSPNTPVRENEQADLTDEQIQQIINDRTQTISKTLAPTYRSLIPQIVEEILRADQAQRVDEFLAVLATDFLLQPSDRIIYQDYTQFKPRAHYTDSSLLKTYFMAMKWLMREKFYFGSPELTKAALVMVSTIQPEDLQQLNQLSQQIKNLIGTDDDLTLNELIDRTTHKNLTSPSEILSNFDEQILQELASLHPQKIQSTSYGTDGFGSTTEKAAKQMTDGFVFFGEKFTLDSYLFDLTTAGSAEEEFTYKPNIQTALIVPDILADNALANQLTKLRLTEKTTEGKIIENPAEDFTQLSSYNRVKQEAQSALEQLSNQTP